MRSTFVIPLLALLTVVGVSRADTYHDAPVAGATGGITGVVDPAAGLQTVVALESSEFKAYQASIDRGAGRFTFHGLPPGEYDLLIKCTGKVYEGVSLDADSDDSESAAPLDMSLLKTQLDDVMKTFITTEDYFNIKHIVRFSATKTHARMFACQTRTKPVVDPAGNPVHAYVRRFDFVDMTKTNKLWQVAKTRHLLRQEIPFDSQDVKITFAYSPNLKWILVGKAVRDLGTLTLDKLPTASPGEKFASTQWSEK